jgi:hypothetical protein
MIDPWKMGLTKGFPACWALLAEDYDTHLLLLLGKPLESWA